MSPPVSPPVSPPRARPREGRDYWLSTVQAAVTAQPVQKESMKFTKELVMVGKRTEVIPDIVNYVFIVFISLLFILVYKYYLIMCNLFIPPTAVFSIHQLFKLCKKLCDDQKTTLIQMYYKTLIQS